MTNHKLTYPATFKIYFLIRYFVFCASSLLGAIFFYLAGVLIQGLIANPFSAQSVLGALFLLPLACFFVVLAFLHMKIKATLYADEIHIQNLFTRGALKRNEIERYSWIRIKSGCIVFDTTPSSGKVKLQTSVTSHEFILALTDWLGYPPKEI